MKSNSKHKNNSSKSTSTDKISDPKQRASHDKKAAIEKKAEEQETVVKNLASEKERRVTKLALEREEKVKSRFAQLEAEAKKDAENPLRRSQSIILKEVQAGVIRKSLNKDGKLPEVSSTNSREFELQMRRLTAERDATLKKIAVDKDTAVRRITLDTDWEIRAIGIEKDAEILKLASLMSQSGNRERYGDKESGFKENSQVGVKKPNMKIKNASADVKSRTSYKSITSSAEPSLYDIETIRESEKEKEIEAQKLERKAGVRRKSENISVFKQYNLQNESLSKTGKQHESSKGGAKYKASVVQKSTRTEELTNHQKGTVKKNLTKKLTEMEGSSSRKDNDKKEKKTPKSGEVDAVVQTDSVKNKSIAKMEAKIKKSSSKRESKGELVTRKEHGTKKPKSPKSDSFEHEHYAKNKMKNKLVVKTTVNTKASARTKETEDI